MKILSFRLFSGAAKVPGDDQMRSSWSAPEFELAFSGETPGRTLIMVRRGVGDEWALLAPWSGVVVGKASAVAPQAKTLGLTGIDAYASGGPVPKVWEERYDRAMAAAEKKKGRGK